MRTVSLTLAQMQSLKGASSVKELQGMARAKGLNLTHDEAAHCFDVLFPVVELSDGQLNQVIGGVFVPPKKASVKTRYW